MSGTLQVRQGQRRPLRRGAFSQDLKEDTLQKGEGNTGERETGAADEATVCAKVLGAAAWTGLQKQKAGKSGGSGTV